MFKRLLKIPLYAAVFLFILFEEIIWEQIAEPIGRYLQSLNFFIRIESLLQPLDGKIILVIFLLLFAIVEVLGFVALALIAKGQVLMGTMVYIAKLPLASFSFWLFKITKEKLLLIGWFATLYGYVMGWFEAIKASEYYQNIREMVLALKAVMKKVLIREKYSLGEKLKRVYRFFKSKRER